MKRYSALLVISFAFSLMAVTWACPFEGVQSQFSSSNFQSSISNLQFPIFNLQSSILKGDANGDGEINVSDAMLVVDKVLGGPAVGFIAANSDMNVDGDINVADVALIIAMILEGGGDMGPGDVEDPDVNGK